MVFQRQLKIKEAKYHVKESNDVINKCGPEDDVAGRQCYRECF